MDRRLELQDLLESLLESDEVYFQPPETIRMKYPAFVYSLSNYEANHADDRPYLTRSTYEVKLITRNPEPELVPVMASTPGFSFDRHYVAENLHHYVFDYQHRDRRSQ